MRRFLGSGLGAAALAGGLLVGLLVAGGQEDAPALPTFPAARLADRPPDAVVRVVDGDTIIVRRGAQAVRVRLIGVDTPETVHPRKPVEPYGREASVFLSNLLTGERVWLVDDGDEAAADRYGRLLAYVYRWPDALFVNAELVRQGYGRAYTRFRFRHRGRFQQLERFAEAAGKGLWASTGPAGDARSRR